MLRKHGARHSLLYAAEKGMLEALAAAIAAGDDVNTPDRVGSTSVLDACLFASVSLCIRVSFDAALQPRALSVCV